jgi:two-component system sensor histidine kinase/response regulator
MHLSPELADRPARILIVDDERNNRQLLELMLAADGFQPLSAASGEEALAMVAQQPPDVILLDVMMPGIDGYRVTEKIKGNIATKNIPIIMVTALNNRDAKMQALSAGAEDFLTKPIDRAELCMRVRNLSRLKAYGDYYEQQTGALTEQATLQSALEESRKEQLRFKDDFLSHVSHELRSPLTAIKQFTRILLGGLAGELNKEQREYQQIVLKNIQQLQSMIDDLLEVTRLETGKLTVELSSVTLADAVTDAINTLEETARAKGITLSCDLPTDLPSAHADRTRVLQVLIILLDNAVKFTPTGGAVQVRVRLLQENHQFLLFEVCDTGCGVSPDVAHRLFERLYQVSEHTQSSRKGLGLGLYICKQLVTRQGGHIWVTSEPQNGSTFAFTLPVFSLDRLIAPLIKDGRWPAESAALLTVHFGFRGASPSSGLTAQRSQQARTFVERCLLPDLDLLLPVSRPNAQGEDFFVAVFADDHGTSVLANRIRGQFERSLSLKQAELTLAVFYRMLPPFAREVGSSIERAVSSMAVQLERATQFQTLPRTSSP